MVPKSMFKTSQPHADVTTSKVCWTLAPLKLFRRLLVEDIRFPEDCMPEDIEFVLRAYVAAQVVSVAAEYDYYHVAAETGDSNASVTTWDDVDSNLRAYERVLLLIDSEPVLSSSVALMRRILKRDICATLHRITIEQDKQLSARWFDELEDVCCALFNEQRLQSLSKEDIELLVAAFCAKSESAEI